MPKKKRSEVGYPYALSIIRHQFYNREVVINNDYLQVLEHLLGLAELYEKQGKFQFFHTLETLAKETHLTLYTVTKAIKHWLNLGVLEAEKRGLHNNNYYSFNYKALMKLVPKLFVDFGRRSAAEMKTRCLKDLVRRIKRKRAYLNKGL